MKCLRAQVKQNSLEINLKLYDKATSVIKLRSTQTKFEYNLEIFIGPQIP